MKRIYLIDARSKTDLTQEEVAIHANIKRQYYNSLEAGDKGGQITLKTVIGLCDALNIDIHEFYRLEEEFKKNSEREFKARKLIKSSIKKEKLDIDKSIPSV